MKKWFKSLLGIDIYENKIKKLEDERLILKRQIDLLREENEYLKANITSSSIRNDLINVIKKYEMANLDVFIDDIEIKRIIGFCPMPYITLKSKADAYSGDEK